MDIQRGARVLVTTAFGDQLERRAVSGVEPGDRFPIVRVCSEDEWSKATREGRPPQATAWPAQDIALPDTE